MTTQQQRKAKARARHEAYVERQRAKTVRRRRRTVVLATVAGVVVVLAASGFLSWVTRDDPSNASNPSDPSTATSPNSTTGDDRYTYKAAAQVLPKGAPADLVLDTNRGTITITLDTERAPENSNSLAFLARKGYFDDTPCHRLTTQGIYVLQCGDRTGTGTGGPGYTTPDENLPDATKNNYPKGTVAMAEPSGGEAGSQFFLVYRDTTLPPDYTIVGEITSGLDVVEQVAQAGVAPDAPTPGDGPPAEKVTITKARIERS